MSVHLLNKDVNVDAIIYLFIFDTVYLINISVNNNNDWFFYGVSPDKSTPVYGVYEATSDCFFLLHTNLEVLKKIAFLFSNRFTLHICRIDCAKNYYPKLLDNSVCNSWTLLNKADFPITRFPNFDQIVEVSKLVKVPGPKMPWNFKENQQYLMAACHWLSWCTDHTIVKIFDIVPGVPFVPSKTKYQVTVDSIFETIYNEFDFSVANKKITLLLAQL